MKWPSKPLVVLFALVAVGLAGAGTYAADSLALTEYYEWRLVFLALFAGSIGGISVVYYAFQLDTAATG